MRKLFQGVKKIGYFIPVSVYFVLFTAILFAGTLWLRNLSNLPDSAYKDIFKLLLTVALLFSAAILLFGLVTVLTSYIYFKWKQRKGLVQLALKTNVNNNPTHSKQLVSIDIQSLMVPLIGFIRIRVLYDADKFSDKFSLVSKKNKLFDFNYSGEFSWNLPEIREYRIERVMVYFEDFFQFFSFTAMVNAKTFFNVNPVAQDIKSINTSPRKTEETTVRIDELKRVEGELINYKNFENNDDVRRIVWKIYAKNKELVVRIPEILDPYASHIYLYTSFYSAFDVKGNTVAETLFLNYYKTIVWSVYKQLQQKGFEVRYVGDQPVPQNSLGEEEERVKYAISVSGWQQEINLKDFVKPHSASVLLVSSLNEVKEVKEFADNFGGAVSVIYVPLTDCLEQNIVKDWIKWLFIENEKTINYTTNWSLSPLRLKVKQNEEELNEVMKQTNKATVI
ncbi:MAG TPA: DUF58 domain-containing protein [Bacteroidia bacterium]|nr:DUF58 domain-containing protein [Bacteroidia bacterium]